MVVLGLAFQVAMHRLQVGRAVYSVGGNGTAALVRPIKDALSRRDRHAWID